MKDNTNLKFFIDQKISILLLGSFWREFLLGNPWIFPNILKSKTFRQTKYSGIRAVHSALVYKEQLIVQFL